MKLKRVLMGMTAAVMTASCLAISASATKLSDVCEPGSDEWNSIGAMGFFMNRAWKWNQGDWIPINEEGTFDLSFEISHGTTMVGTEETADTLGSMGFMFANIPEGNYPYSIEVSDAKFTKEDGTVIELNSWNKAYDAEEFVDGGIRIVIRSDDEVDETTGELITAATPEVAGWEEPGAFTGGTLSMKVNLNADGASAPDTTEPDTTEPEVPDTTEPDATEPETPADTGAETPALAMLALCGIAVVASKKRTVKD